MILGDFLETASVAVVLCAVLQQDEEANPNSKARSSLCGPSSQTVVDVYLVVDLHRYPI